MTQINILFKPFQGGEAKTIGKVFFLLGVGFLSFSGTSLLGFKDFCAEHPAPILFLLVASFVLLLAGESLIALSAPLRGKLFLRWMAEPLRLPRQSPVSERQCQFCGMKFFLPPVSDSREESRERDFDRLIFGVCLGCGKVVCPKCAYFKGLELKIKSLHCPGCGSLIL